MSAPQLMIGQDGRLYYPTGELFGKGFTVALPPPQPATSLNSPPTPRMASPLPTGIFGLQGWGDYPGPPTPAKAPAQPMHTPLPPPPPPPRAPAHLNTRQLFEQLTTSQIETHRQLAALTGALKTLADSMTLMQQLQQAQPVAQTTTSVLTSVYKPPQPFKGHQGPDARRFLAAYAVWAMHQPQLRSRTSASKEEANPRKWITACLGYLQEDAAIWATPALEQLRKGQDPYGGNWQKFEEVFKLRFETTDELHDACEYIKALFQGTSTLAEYKAKFEEYKDRTGFSDPDLQERFYEHLASYMKDLLSNTERAKETYNELVTTCMVLDQCWQDRKIERARERGRAPPPGSAPARAATLPPRFTTPARDPNAMDVDAAKTGGNGKTLDNYHKFMSGRCYGCAGTGHLKKDGNHAGDLCGHCAKMGHRKEACQQKFLGFPATAPQRANAATHAGPSMATTTAQDADAGDGPPSATVAATAHVEDFGDVLKTLMDQQAALSQRISEMQAFF
jgi:hypothetical protein